jgi:uncharacterized protein
MARPRPADHERTRENTLLDELAAVYRDVDAAYAAYRCPGTSECCHFAVTGREPYVTSIELAAMQRAIAARGGALPAKRRALSMYPGEYRDERICPLLTTDGRCSIYAARPLGCRSFWCHRADVPADAVARDALTQFVRRIQAIATRHQPGGDQGRPLSKALPG